MILRSLFVHTLLKFSSPPPRLPQRTFNSITSPHFSQSTVRFSSPSLFPFVVQRCNDSSPFSSSAFLNASISLREEAEAFQAHRMLTQAISNKDWPRFFRHWTESSASTLSSSDLLSILRLVTRLPQRDVAEAVFSRLQTELTSSSLR